MADKIYGLNERDKRLLQQMLREFNRLPRDFLSPRGNPRVRSTSDRFYFRNDSGETIPAGAIMRCTDIEVDDDGVTVYVMDKPVTSEWKLPWYVNLGVDIEDGDFGWCATFRGEAGLAYYISGSLTVGESWGPKGGQWELEQHYPGFRIVGNEADGLVYVVQREPRILLAKSDSGGISGRSGTTLGSASDVILRHRNGATIGETTFAITAYNQAVAAVDGDTELKLAYIDGDWFAVWEEC